MSQDLGSNKNTVYRLVLTGGPCGGKTTGQARLCTFFENLGWKVYRVPECATVLMSGGVKWTELSEDSAFKFQENLLKTMMQMENTFFSLADNQNRNCLVVCDRGTMDASAFLSPDLWDRMMRENGWNNVELRDNRYNQVIHMVSAAKGAEEFYTTEDHVTRYEPVELARELDDFAAQAWVGHPYYDVIDNTTNFENKINRMIASVCNRLGIDTGERLSSETKKRKFLIKRLPEPLDKCWTWINSNNKTFKINGDEGTCALADAFPQFQDFIVVHDYLVTPSRKMQARIRKRGQNVEWDSEGRKWNLETGNWTYIHTVRLPEISNQSPELRMPLSNKDYEMLLAQRDEKHYTIYKTRKCFLWNNQYFQMDIYQEPCDKRCKGLILLETFTTCKKELALPSFLEIEGEVTDNPKFSMYNLSMRDEEQYHKHILNGDCLLENDKIESK